MKVSFKIAAVPLLASGLVACGQGPEPDSVRVMKSDGDFVVLSGLIDATRKTPPQQYETLAAQECGRADKTAVFVEMKQKTTFVFDAVYRCVEKG